MPQSVLIVDDSTTLHELIKVHLSEEPLVLHSAFDGPGALTLAASLDPDVILLDLDMPGMNGFEVCRILKASQVTAHIPIIFLTAAASADDKVCGLELQAADYITKPFDGGELCARVRSALRTKRLLDMLPRRAADGAAADQTAEGVSLNTRLSMKQLMRARSENPWDRKPPPKAATTAGQARVAVK